MDILLVPPAVRDKLGDAASDGLVTMFAEAHRLAVQSFGRTVRETEDRLDRRIAEVSERFDRKLAEEISTFRVEMIDRMAELRFDVLKWSFLCWIGQVAVMIAVLSWMLRGIR